MKKKQPKFGRSMRLREDRDYEAAQLALFYLQGMTQAEAGLQINRSHSYVSTALKAFVVRYTSTVFNVHAVRGSAEILSSLDHLQQALSTWCKEQPRKPRLRARCMPEDRRVF
jgi:hypothetical protein